MFKPPRNQLIKTLEGTMRSKLVAIPIFVLLILRASFAQNIAREAPIIAGEYFIGQDPGKGKGTPIPINPSAAKVEVAISNIPLQANQTIYVRFKNNNGYWTAPRGITHTGAGVQRSINLTQAEYFRGVDPGRGKGTPITITQGTTTNLNLPTLSLQKGQKLSIRVKDAENRWSTPTTITYSGVGGKRSALLTYTEYFIGTDPGHGKGTSIAINQALELILNPPSQSLQKGQNVYFRVKDSENRWSDPAAIGYSGYGLKRGALIAYAEYFIGADPGRGKGAKININQADSLRLQLASVALTQGQKLRLRVQDTEKRWSDPVALSYPPRFIRRAEIVVADNPAKVPVGNGIPMAPVDGAWGSVYEAIQGIVASWNQKDSIWVRAQSSEHLWSKPLGDIPNKTPIASAANQFKSDGITALPEGGTTNENKVVFKATISDPDLEQVKLQIELRKSSETFSGSPNLQSSLVNSGARVTITRDSLSFTNYKWRYRVMDARGLANEWVEFGTAGNTDFVVNRTPTHTAANQFKADGTTAISEGGTTNENKVVFKATVTDPDGEQVKLQIELRKTTEAFTGVPILQSGLVNSGTPVTLTRDSLAFVNYKWRCRAVDARGLASAWVDFGTAGNIDFTVNRPPTHTAVNQFKSDGTTNIPEGGTTNEKKVVFKATVSDPDGDQVKLQIELRKFGEAFTGLPNLQSGLVNSSAQVMITRDSLVVANYKWRYRAIDVKGLASFWVDFGAPANIDFVVAANKPPATPTALNQFKADGSTNIPEGGTTNENKVIFKATVTDPDGEQVKLQIELRKTTEAFNGTPTLPSSLVNSGTPVTITRDSLGSGNYKWRCRTTDARGLSSAWVEFGTAGNTDFTVISEVPIFPAVAGPRASGTEFWVDIKVGDNANPVSNLFGVSFVLNFTPTDYIDVVAPYLSNVIAGSFLGSDVILHQTVDETSGKVNVGISRKAGQGGVNNNGTVLRVKFVALAYAPDSTTATFFITDVSANDPNGAPIKLTPRSQTVMINNKDVIVWPGDTNNDGVVNQADVLPIGLYWGSKGPARPNASMNWIGQPSPSWTPSAAMYANANGDTIVNQAEVPVIGFNWGKSHFVPSLLANGALEKSQTPASATIVPEAIPSEQAPDHEFFVQIKVAEVSNLFGLSFELIYDQPQIVQTLSAEPEAWFGNDVVFYSHVDAAAGKVAVGISRKAGQTGVNGAGTVVHVKAKIAANATVGAKINFSLKTLAANDDKGAAISLTSQSSSITVGRVTAVISDEETALPASYRLHQNHPNPFNAGTLIKYEIPQAGQVLLQIYNLAGQEILRLVNAVQQPGRYQINWDGRDQHGRPAPSGFYIYRLQADSFIQSYKMLLVR
jgi:invasion protein IalB